MRRAPCLPTTSASKHELDAVKLEPGPEPKLEGEPALKHEQEPELEPEVEIKHEPDPVSATDSREPPERFPAIFGTNFAPDS